MRRQYSKLHLAAGLRMAAAATVIGALVPSAIAAQSETSGEITGTVTVAETGLPLRHAVVSVDELRKSVRTNAAGRYRLRGVPPGAYTITYRRLGYEPWTLVTEIRAGDHETVNVFLAPQPVRLAALEVLRERTELGHRAADLPGSAHVIAAEEFDAHTRLSDDVHQVLKQVPGVTIQEEDGFGLRPNIGMRGTGSERSAKITVMEDGVLIAPAPYAAPAAYYFPLMGRMRAIEVRKGSSQIKHGPRTVGGVINLLSHAIPDRFTVAADLVGGANATRKVSARLGDTYANLGWMVEGYRNISDGFKQLDAAGSTGFDLENYVGKLRWNSIPTGSLYRELELKFGYYDERSDETYLGLTEDDFKENPVRRYAASQQDVMDAEHRQLQARYFVRPNQRIDLTTTAYRNDFKRNWYKLQSVGGQGIADVLSRPADFPVELAMLRGADSDPGALTVRANNREYFGQGIQSVVGLRLGNAGLSHQIEVGARFHEDQEDRFQHEDAFRMARGNMQLSEAGVPGSQSNRISDARAFSAFVQNEIVFGRWVVTPGARYETVELTRSDFATPVRDQPDRVRQNTVTALIPGIGASYEIWPAMYAFGGVHRGFGPPSPGSDEDAEAERSVNYEIGFRASGDALNASVVGFYTDYDNVLGTSTLSTGADGTGVQFNGGRVRVLGLEASAGVDPLFGRSATLALPVTFALTYTTAEFRTDFESEYDPWGIVTSGDALPYQPAVQLHASVGLQAANWNVSTTSTYTSPMRTVAGQGPIEPGEGTDAAFLVNASGEYQLRPWSSVFLGVQNLFNKSHVVALRPAGLRPGLPRAVLAGLRVRR